MKKPPVVVEFTWSEAINLIAAGLRIDTTGWTPAARGALKRAVEKIVFMTPMEDPNAVFIAVRGQTPADETARRTIANAKNI